MQIHTSVLSQCHSCRVFLPSYFMTDPPDPVTTPTSPRPEAETDSVYTEHGERDSLNEPCSIPASANSSDCEMRTRAKNMLGLLTPRSSNMLEHTEPFCYLWVLLSSLYGKLLVVLMIAFSLVEVMDNSVKLLSLQGIYLMYLYVGSIAVIICIYIWVLVDSCASFHNENDGGRTMVDAELGTLSLTRFGSLKRAHISRDKTSATSFYLRVGALGFGLGTLVFNGLEMAMHSMMEGACLNDVVFVHPVLHGLFTFLQMHFLFVNSQVLVERFGLIARFGFMHLAATNLALWARLVVWESGIEWTYFVHLAQSGHSFAQTSTYSDDIPSPLQLKGFPRAFTSLSRHQRDIVFKYNSTWVSDVYRPISDNQISQVVALHQCLNTNSLGQLWTSSMPFLYPFIVQFSLIAAGVTYVMGQNVGTDRIRKIKPHTKKTVNNNNVVSGKVCQSSYNVDARYSSSNIDCTGASKGLFLGLLCVVASIVVIIIFLVVKEDDGFPAETLFWITTGTVGVILLLSTIVTIPGLIQIRKLSHTGKSPITLDSLLSAITLAGVHLYSLFGIVVGASAVYRASPHSIQQQQHIMLLAVSALQLIQSTIQSTLIEEGIRRGAITRNQQVNTPARQVITFLLCSNTALWALDSFVTQSWLSQELQLKFMGVLAWGVVSRITLPLLVFYRFHSGVLLLEIWQRTYRSNRSDNTN